MVDFKKPALQRLSFESGQFVLTTGDVIRGEQLRENERWKLTGPYRWVTQSLAAARDFRVWADERTEKLFKKAFQCRYPLPEPARLAWATDFLDTHQKRGYEWAITRKRSYLAHAPGAGKTWTALAVAFSAHQSDQTLILVPPSLTGNWVKEIERVSDQMDLLIAVGVVRRKNEPGELAERADVVLCPDSLLPRPETHAYLKSRSWGVVIVDEASRYKEPTATRSIALFGGRMGDRFYPDLFRSARHTILLDGSPMPNRPIELWPPVYACDPESIDCMGYDDFGYRYGGAKPNERGVWEYKYSSNEAELKARLQKNFMHVVTEGELSHPERRRSMVFIQDDVRSVEHKQWERANLTPGYEFSEEKNQGALAVFRRELGIAKIPYIAERVRDRLENSDEQILLFAWHREVILKLAEVLLSYNPGIIMGGVAPGTRDVAMQAFQANEIRLLIMNIAAAGRGHNLQAADRVIFGEFSWTDELNRQCEKRASRRGSEKEFVRCEYLVSPNSMDERILSALFSKEKRVKKVIG